MTHPALAPGKAAVITGAASGIGLAAAQRFAALGMAVCMADVNTADLEREAATLRDQGADVLALTTDVSNPAQVTALRDAALSRWGAVTVLMNNAGREAKSPISAGPEVWRRILETNLWGVINGLQTFTPMMLEAGQPALIINTGSKQGITMPPGNTAYNVSKAGVKAITEAVAHDLLGTPVSAHLLIPGFTFTGFTRVRVATQPPGAWSPEQVVDFMLQGLERGDFYILCPDNDTTRAQDEKRIQWAADDIIKNRPALSRWHPDHVGAFRAYMEE